MDISTTDLGRLLSEKESDKEKVETLLEFVSMADVQSTGELNDRLLEMADASEPHVLAVALHLVVVAKLVRGNLADAMPMVERALELYESVGDRGGQGRLLFQLSGAEMNCSDYVAAHRHLQSALVFFEKPRDERMVAACYNRIGKIRALESDFVAALNYLGRAADIDRRLDNGRGYANDLSGVGSVYHTMNRYDESLEYLLKGLAVSEDLKDLEGISGRLLHVALVYLDLEDYDRALEHLHRAYAIAEEIGGRQKSSRILHNIATAYIGRGEYDRALESLERALVIKQALGNRQGVATALNNIGNVYKTLGDYNRALEYYNRSLTIKESLGKKQTLASTLSNMGAVYIDQGDIPSALDVLERGLVLAGETHEHMMCRNIRRNLAEAYRTLGDFERALEHFEQYATLDREIFGEVSAKRLHELTVAFEVERAEREASILRLTNERLEREIEFKNKELTTNALYLTRKNQILREVSHRLGEIVGEPTASLPKQLRGLTMEIDQAVNTEDYWATFERQFKQVHSDFLEILAERYPKLTPTELKVCALIKIDLSTKEIAQILNTEARSVEKYRQRIRKKLMLRQDENLNAFLLTIDQ